MIRIIAGEFRSRHLLSPRDETISRPMAGRVKESIFNLLRGWFEGATVVDLFAGVGTAGLEAISRGAARAFLFERDREIFSLLERNIGTLNCGDRATAIHADVFAPTTLRRVNDTAEIIFVDPPYEMMRDVRSRARILDLIHRCRAIMGSRGFVVLRSPIGLSETTLSIEGFNGPEEHHYGHETHVLLYSPASRLSDHTSTVINSSA